MEKAMGLESPIKQGDENALDGRPTLYLVCGGVQGTILLYLETRVIGNETLLKEKIVTEMRITSILFYKVHNIPYKFRGKYATQKKPTLKDIIEFKKDLEREEKNMVLLRHPYLTSEQSSGHMREFKDAKFLDTLQKWREERNEKFNRVITIADRLNHLNVNEAWD